MTRKGMKLAMYVGARNNLAMKIFALSFFSLLFQAQAWCEGLVSPRSSLSYDVGGQEMRASVLANIGGNCVRPGSLGFMVNQGTQDWVAISILPTESKDVAEMIFLCKGMPYGDPSRKLIRRKINLSEDIRLSLYARFNREIGKARNIPAVVNSTDIGLVEYWVAVSGGEILSGLSFSYADNPPALDNALHLLIDFAKSDGAEQERWRSELIQSLK